MAVKKFSLSSKRAYTCMSDAIQRQMIFLTHYNTIQITAERIQIEIKIVERVFASGASKYAFTTLSHTLYSLLLVASLNQWPHPPAPV